MQDFHTRDTCGSPKCRNTDFVFGYIRVFTYETRVAATDTSRTTQKVRGIASLVAYSVVSHFSWHPCGETPTRHFNKLIRTRDWHKSRWHSKISSNSASVQFLDVHDRKFFFDNNKFISHIYQFSLNFFHNFLQNFNPKLFYRLSQNFQIYLWALV